MEHYSQILVRKKCTNTITILEQFESSKSHNIGRTSKYIKVCGVMALPLKNSGPYIFCEASNLIKEKDNQSLCYMEY